MIMSSASIICDMHDLRDDIKNNKILKKQGKEKINYMKSLKDLFYVNVYVVIENNG